MRWIVFPLTVVVVVLAACDSGSPGTAEGSGALAAVAFPGLSVGSEAEVQDTMPMVVRRVWYTTSFDIWNGPSADGRFLPVTDWSGTGTGGALAVHDFVTGETRRITPEVDPFPAGYAENAAISGDGRRVAYAWWSEDGGWELRLVDVEGHGPRVLYHDQALEVRPRQWSTDGQTVLVSASDNRDNLLGLVKVGDGSLQVLKRMGQRHSVGLVMSPDGRYVAYDDMADDGPQRDVFVITVATGEEKRLVEDPADDLVLGWAPDGNHVLFASDRTGTMGAWLLPVSGGVATGSPRLVKPDLWRAEAIGFDGNGSFFYVVSMNMRDVFLATLDLETGQLLDRPTRVSSGYIGSNGAPEWSPDGSRLAYFSERKRWRELGSEVIVIRSAETGEEKELQPDLASYMHPRWSPDGQSLLVRARDEFGRGFFLIDVQTGEVEPLIRFPAGSPNIASRAEWIEDGRALLYWWPSATVAPDYVPVSDGEHFTLRIRDLDSGREEIIFEGYVSPRFAVSPDRKQVAFSSVREGRSNVMVMPVGGGEPTLVLGDLGESEKLADQPSEIQWSPDGRYLYYEQGGLWRVPVRGGEPEKLDWFEDAQARPFFRFQPGGSRLALMCAEGEGGGEVWVMEDFLPGPGDAQDERRVP